jgi:hypothetical protein
MEALLKKYGIKELNCRYEYSTAKIDWWDAKNETAFEIEYFESDEDSIVLDIYFIPEIEGIVERVWVFRGVFNAKLDNISEETLVAQKITDHFAISKVRYDAEQGGVLVNSFAQTSQIVEKILSLIKQKTPISIHHDDDESGFDSEEQEGNILEHFMAMYRANYSAFSEKNTLDNIKTAIRMEGVEYMKILKQDIAKYVTNPSSFDREIMGKLGKKEIELLVKTIQNYK